MNVKPNLKRHMSKESVKNLESEIECPKLLRLNLNYHSLRGGGVSQMRGGGDTPIKIVIKS